MIRKETIRKIIDEKLGNGPLFVVDICVKPGNIIEVFLDGDRGVSIADCTEVSRLIESQLDRDIEDYELEVSSAGVDRPLSLPRQYVKNTGRMLRVTTKAAEIFKGKIMMADEKGIEIEIAPDKKKKTPAKSVSIFYSDIDKAMIEVSFK